MDPFLAKTPEQLGDILRGYRQKHGLTQQALAAQLGLPQKAISLAETRPERLSLDRLFRLLGALGVELTLSERPSSRKSRAEW